LAENMYGKIVEAWTNEVEKEELQNLEHLRLTKMTQYLSKIRLLLTETRADNVLQADLYTQEILNLEYMLKDILLLRRQKILRAASAQRRPLGTMTLDEEEFFNRLIRAFEKYNESTNEILSGTPQATIKRGRGKDEPSLEDSEETSYILVKFQRAIEEPFLGIDEMTYGPFKEQDIATIPADNAKSWLNDGTVTRVTVEEGGS